MSPRTLGLAAVAAVVIAGAVVLMRESNDRPHAPTAAPAAAPSPVRSSVTGATDVRPPAPTLPTPVPVEPHPRPAAGAADLTLAAPAPQLRPEIQDLNRRALQIGKAPGRPVAATPDVDEELIKARKHALTVLEKIPDDVASLEVMVQSACASGDVDEARKYLAALPAGDQEQARRACDHTRTKVPTTRNSAWSKGELQPTKGGSLPPPPPKPRS